MAKDQRGRTDGLVLRRTPGQRVVLFYGDQGEYITIQYDGHRARDGFLRIFAPSGVKVLREELVIRDEGEGRGC